MYVLIKTNNRLIYCTKCLLIGRFGDLFHHYQVKNIKIKKLSFFSRNTIINKLSRTITSLDSFNRTTVLANNFRTLKKLIINHI